MTTLLYYLPEDLKREVARKVTVDKMKKVLDELMQQTSWLCQEYDLVITSYSVGYFDNVERKIRPVYFKCFCREYISICHEDGKFGWALCYADGDLVENTFSIASRNHRIIKEHLLKNESSKNAIRIFK
jgi:hypothetical protein